MRLSIENGKHDCVRQQQDAKLLKDLKQSQHFKGEGEEKGGRLSAAFPIFRRIPRYRDYVKLVFNPHFSRGNGREGKLTRTTLAKILVLSAQGGGTCKPA